MDQTEVAVIVFVLTILIILYSKFQKQPKEFTSAKPTLRPSNIPALKYEDSKPSEFELQNALKENLDLYNYLNQKLTLEGETVLQWKGQQNGWILTLKEGSGRYGVINLCLDVLTGQTMMSSNQFFGILSDERVPKNFKPYFNTLENDGSSQIGQLDYYQVKFPLLTQSDCDNFICIIQLMKWYG